MLPNDEQQDFLGEFLNALLHKVGGSVMVNQEKFQELAGSYPVFAGIPDKLAEVVRDEIKPSDNIVFAAAAKVNGHDGGLYVTDSECVCFYLMKAMIFLKMPTLQTYHLSQMVSVDVSGNQVALHAVADPANPEDDYEKGTVVFTNSADVTKFTEIVTVS